MPTVLATKADATQFHLKMEIGIKDADSGRVLVASKWFECTIPIPANYSSHQARMVRSENLALEQFAEQLRADLETNPVLKKKLKNVEWALFSKTVAVKEL